MGYTPNGQTRRKVFRYVRKRLLSGRPPTIREVQEEFGFRAVQTAREHLERLVRDGKLAKDQGCSRGYRLPARSGPPAVMVPVLGRVPAGELSEAILDPEGYLVMRTRRSPSRLFALRVRGESMVGAGILPGDVVIVRRQQFAESGDIVVAQVEEEATVKRLQMRSGQVELHPENPEFGVIVPQGEVQILGKVIEVRRSLES